VASKAKKCKLREKHHREALGNGKTPFVGYPNQYAHGHGLRGFLLGIPAGRESCVRKNRMRAGDGLFALDLVHGVFDFSALFIDR